jgi:excisionase family DNA binding protein
MSHRKTKKPTTKGTEGRAEVNASVPEVRAADLPALPDLTAPGADEPAADTSMPEPVPATGGAPGASEAQGPTPTTSKPAPASTTESPLAPTEGKDRAPENDKAALSEDDLEFLKRRGRKGADALPVPEGGRLLTVKEAAAELHCSISFVYKLMDTRQLAFERRGRRKLPLAVSLAEYRQQSRCQATIQAPRTSRSPRQPYQFQRLFRDESGGPGK